MPGPPRTTALIENTPRLDVPRLLTKDRDWRGERAGGHLRLRFGALCRWRADLQAKRLSLAINGRSWSHYRLLPGRGRWYWRCQCPACLHPAELIYWPVSQLQMASAACAQCSGVRGVSGYLTGTRASTGRRTVLLRRELRAGNIAGVVNAQKRDPSWWLAGQQALEMEGVLPRQVTLENGNVRRWRKG